MGNMDLRHELCKYAEKIVKTGLVVGPGGNMSARAGDKMYCSPSGFAMEEIAPEQWVEIDIPTGEMLNTAYRPTSEVLMHLYCYRADDSIGAIVHTHPASCIAFTLVAKQLPIMFPDQAALVGKTAYVPYVLPTTKLLAEAVAKEAAHASSILLGNHGLVTTGRNLREAYYRTQIVDESAKVYMSASAVGPITPLTDEEFREVATLESEEYRIKLLQQMK